MKRLLAAVCFLFLHVLACRATHIVGGGFSYSRLSGNTYRFSLTLFFDFINGNTGAKDDRVTCHIFRRGTNQYMDSIRMPLSDSTRFLQFSNPSCSKGVNIRTQVLVYSTSFFLSPSRYNQPDGYYIVWERCCRNAVISNIREPGATGQTFYMEFPPVVRNGVSFINQSPVFGLLQADYPCLGNPFRLAFGATDADGDSLSYALVNPLRGNSTANFPRGLPPIPGPYIPVNWGNSFSASNAIPGNPALRVNPLTGELSLTASRTGLFVFSVCCSEFRNGLKIGEVRREMQIPVLDCPFNNPPRMVVRQTFSSPPLAEEDTLYAIGGVRPTCPTIAMTDRERGEPVSIRIIPLSPNAPSGLSAVRNLSLGNSSDSVFSSFCIPACTFAPPAEPWRVMFVASDFGCGGSKSDTLILNLVVTRPDPPVPEIDFSPPLAADTITFVQTQGFDLGVRATVGQAVPMRIFSRFEDSLGNAVTGFSLKLPEASGTGTLNSRFFWPEICGIPPHSPYRLTSIAESDFCGALRYDTLVRLVQIIPKDLTIRLRSSYSGPQPVVLREQESAGFTLTGELNEQKPLQLSAEGSLSAQPGFSFRGGFGTGQVSSDFRFSAICGGASGSYEVLFRTFSRFCGRNVEDTLRYRFDLIYEPDTLGRIPNLLTANADGKNDALVLAPISAKETCANQFEFVEVYNRWGQKVYYSASRDFRWEPEPGNTDMYFFALHFKNKTIRSWMSVLGDARSVR